MADSNENQNPNLLETRVPRRSELDSNNPVVLAEQVYHLWWNWADFHLYIISPHSDHHTSPNIIEPENIAGTDEQEFVYRIHDWGDRFSTSAFHDEILKDGSLPLEVLENKMAVWAAKQKK